MFSLGLDVSFFLYFLYIVSFWAMVIVFFCFVYKVLIGSPAPSYYFALAWWCYWQELPPLLLGRPTHANGLILRSWQRLKIILQTRVTPTVRSLAADCINRATSYCITTRSLTPYAGVGLPGGTVFKLLSHLPSPRPFGPRLTRKKEGVSRCSLARQAAERRKKAVPTVLSST